MSFIETMAKLCEPYRGDQITTRQATYGGDESWVEQHHIFDRLNELGIPFTWEIRECLSKEVSVGGNQKPGQHAYVKGRLTIYVQDRTLFYDGVGEATMVGDDNARKGAASKSFRHAAKPFTTFLWGGGMVQSEPKEVERSKPETPAAKPSEPKQAPPQTSSHQVETNKAGIPSDAPPKLLEALQEWNQEMGKVGDNCRMERADFETVIWRSITAQEYPENSGKWQSEVSRGYKTFQDFACEKTANGFYRIRPSFDYKKDAAVIAGRLASGENVELRCLVNKQGDFETIVLETRENSLRREADEVHENITTEANDDVPF